MDGLRKFVTEQRKKLAAAALTTGTVDKEAFDGLDRLSKLAADSRPARRWLIPAVVFLLLTIFVALQIKRQGETEIELDLALTELRFRLPRNGPAVTVDQFLRSLRADALNGIELDGASWPAPQNGTCSLRVELDRSSRKEEAITLPPLAPPKDWEVGVFRAGSESDFEFTAPPNSAGPDFMVRAVLRGKAAISTDCTPDGKNRNVAWNGPGSLTMWIGASTTLRCESALPVRFARQIEFENLRLYAVERVQIGTAPVDRRRSSVVSGTLYLDALNAKAIGLRPFEDLKFASSKGYIRALSIPADSKPPNEELHLQAHATVQQMKLGSGVNERSQMPSWLEVLSAQTGVALMWASALYVFGIVYAVLRWLKITN